MLLLPEAMHAAWEHMERAGGDAPVAVRVCESTQAQLARIITDYHVTYVASAPQAAKGAASPPAEYVALALLYGMPGVYDRLHAGMRAYLPDLRSLKAYGSNVHRFTAAQRYVAHAAAHALCRPRLAPGRRGEPAEAAVGA